MAKSKKVRRIHICPTCKGNGYVKIQNIYDIELQVHQCWDCDSEGEFYVHEPQDIQPDDYVDPTTGDVVKLN